MKIPEYVLVRSDRRTLAVQVGPDGITVRSPRRTPQREIDRFVFSHLDWINKKLSQIPVSSHAEPFSRAELDALRDEASKWFPEAVGRLAPLVGASVAAVKVRPMLSRWGSCKSDGTLCFNTLLVLLPENVRESVVLHELCHRFYMDHSPRFHALLKSVCPDYPALRRVLLKEGAALTQRLRNTRRSG
ncbi:MAG: M48 family metallopeptidase [Clostridia bacterium]|nr:M48 family metallopeptidase [Clostridia bacterium]